MPDVEKLLRGSPLGVKMVHRTSDNTGDALLVVSGVI